MPYELPFIAITEKAFTRLVNEQYEVLQRGIAIHKRLERLVLEERGLDEVVRALAAAIGGAVMVLDRARRDDRLAARSGASCRAEALEAMRAEVARAQRARAAEAAAPSSRPTIPSSAAARSCCRCSTGGRGGTAGLARGRARRRRRSATSSG